MLDLYSNPRLLAAAAAQPPAMQQIANLRQLEMYKLMMQQQQQQAAARLLPSSAVSNASPSVPAGGGLVNFQQASDSSLTPSTMPRLQLSTMTAQRPSSQQQRLGMPTLTPARVHAPISHVPTTNFSRSEALRSLPTLTPSNLRRVQNSLSSPIGSYHQDPSPTASNRPHLSSQQVT